ncbi:MAG: glycogen/starch synthase [Halioglobus sp.]
MKILMAAAENDALPGGKVGGIGDVVRDIPVALAAAGHQVDVVTPGYGAFSNLPGAENVGSVEVMFCRHPHTVELFKVPGKTAKENVTLWVLEHPLFAAGGEGKIYCDDPGDRPFATDAGKFALFSVALAQAIVDDLLPAVDVLHLHDWHAAMVGVLRAFDPAYKALQSIHTVYTIHNLALQGVRPLSGDESSLHAWFPELDYDLEKLNDTRAPHCINPMRAGINLSDKVHAVSPTYAREIQRASDPERGFFGGEGLHADLQAAAGEGRLHGILNGCEYPAQTARPLSPGELFLLCENESLKWIGKNSIVESAHLIASRRLAQIISAANTAEKDQDQPCIITSVGRITDQKVLLLRQIMPDGATALDQLLDVLGDKGFFILLGSGDTELEQFLTEVASRRRNFIFLKGYSEALSHSLYSSGDLFLMPSSFEPCGISQMLAMRAGQPCLVHSVGGLSDTVRGGEDGFAFTGDSLQNQAENMIVSFELALKTKREDGATWEKISEAAAAARFLWSDVADEIVDQLYVNP